MEKKIVHKVGFWSALILSIFVFCFGACVIGGKMKWYPGNRNYYFIIILALIIFCCRDNGFDSISYDQALENGRMANEGLRRCQKYMNAWLTYSDPATGLIPRNLTGHRHIWNAQDAAADNYPSMVLTSAITDRKMFGTLMLDLLKNETLLTSRIG